MKKLVVVLFVLSVLTLSTSAYGTACYAACSGHSCSHDTGEYTGMNCFYDATTDECTEWQCISAPPLRVLLASGYVPEDVCMSCEGETRETLAWTMLDVCKL